jgi:signal transduction histidine kinase/ActR/RegA family two-component response regulator
MAGEGADAAPEEGQSSGFWRGAMASAGALLATILLAGLLLMVNSSNAARDAALAAEHHSYDVMLLTSNVDGSVARAEGSLGRYVLDPQLPTGGIYYNEWVLAGEQIDQLQRLVRDNPSQQRRVDALRALYNAYGARLGVAAAAAREKKGMLGVSLFYQATKQADPKDAHSGRNLDLGSRLRTKLAEISIAEREDLYGRMTATSRTSDRADTLTGWFGWLALLIGLGAVTLGILSIRAMRGRLEALREAHSEAGRARQLEEAVRERTSELVEANEALKAEAAEREAAEAQLRQVQKMEAVGQLTGGIAHDFNNMLAVVVGGLDLARRKLSSDRREAEFHLDNAMEGATRAAALTRRLLAFARSEPLLATAVAPAELIENMLELVDRSIGERITVRTHFPAERWYARVDTNQLENAILNMAVNARDAMDGQGQLAISIDNAVLAAGQIGTLAAGDHVRISVSDTGSGIAPAHIERVFEPFFTTKPVGKGTGLGLSQIFAFARQSGGDVTLESTVGLGTTISLYLPRSAEPGESGEARAPAARIESEAPVRRIGARILVVEDDPRVSRSTVGALVELDYRPSACASGREALEILTREEGFELIVTDVMMPEMTGPELVRAAARLYPWIAILYVTGYVGEAGDADDLAGQEILRKPFTVSALDVAVAAALARTRLDFDPVESKSA